MQAVGMQLQARKISQLQQPRWSCGGNVVLSPTGSCCRELTGTQVALSLALEVMTNSRAQGGEDACLPLWSCPGNVAQPQFSAVGAWCRCSTAVSNQKTLRDSLFLPLPDLILSQSKYASLSGGRYPLLLWAKQEKEKNKQPQLPLSLGSCLRRVGKSTVCATSSSPAAGQQQAATPPAPAVPHQVRQTCASSPFYRENIDLASRLSAVQRRRIIELLRLEKITSHQPTTTVATKPHHETPRDILEVSTDSRPPRRQKVRR